MTTTYFARESHHSISRAPAYTLRAKTDCAAKTEARKLLGDGFRGQTIYLEEDLGEGVRGPVAWCTIGIPGWVHI